MMMIGSQFFVDSFASRAREGRCHETEDGTRKDQLRNDKNEKDRLVSSS
jgi:hypothetical protein